LLVLRGVDDEASLVLAAGAIGNRVFRLAANYLTITVIVSFFVIFVSAIIGIKISDTQNWLVTGFLACPVVAVVVVSLSGIFKSTVGRELFFRCLTAEANIQSTPDVGPDTEMTVKTLRAGGRNMRHKLYDHPAICDEIVNWFCSTYGRRSLIRNGEKLIHLTLISGQPCLEVKQRQMPASDLRKAIEALQWRWIIVRCRLSVVSKHQII
jgi:hypothetical protein